MGKTLIDGDIVAYRCAFAHKDDSVDLACKGVDELMEFILNECSFYNSTGCLLYTSPSPRDVEESRMPSSA